MTALLLLACASLTLHPAFEPAGLAPPPAMGEVLAAQPPQQVYDEAMLRLEDGDLRGAAERLVWLDAHGLGGPQVRFALGQTFEAGADYERALQLYDLLIQEVTEPWIPQVAFKRALVLEQLDQWDEALQTWKSIDTEQVLDPDDVLRVRIGRASAELLAGRSVRGDRQLAQAMTDAAGVQGLEWMRARGHTARVQHLVRSAAEYRMEGREKRQQKDLEARAELIAAAEREVVQVVQLEQPYWIAVSLMAFGDAFAGLDRDLRAAPAPRRLDAEQEAMYRAAVGDKAAVLRRKAWEAYDQGIQLAGRLPVDRVVVESLTARRDALEL